MLASVCSPIRAMEVSGVDPVEVLGYDSLIVISVPVGLHRLPLIAKSPYTLRPHFLVCVLLNRMLSQDNRITHKLT